MINCGGVFRSAASRSAGVVRVFVCAGVFSASVFTTVLGNLRAGVLYACDLFWTRIHDTAA